MSLEAATYISDLVQANPAGGDNASQGDDHLRLVKTVLQTTFPNASRPKYLPNSGATKISGFSTANTDDDKAFQCDATSGTLTVVLSATTIDGLSFFFQKIDSSSNAVVLDPASTVLINGASTLSLSKQWSGVRVIWLNTYGAWLALPTSGVVPYYSGGQDIPFSDIAPSANAKRILGAATATDFSEQTIATVLEWLGTAARGDIILRGASAFAYLNIGSDGKVPASNGTDLAYAYPAVIQRVYAEYATNADLSTTIPLDDTIPQSGEGTQVLSASITLKSATNRLRVTFSSMASGPSAGTSTTFPKAIAALFQDSVADALYAKAVSCAENSGSSNNVQNAATAALDFVFEYVPGTTSAITLKIRVGADSGTIRLNGSTAARYFGGVAKATMVLEELGV